MSLPPPKKKLPPTKPAPQVPKRDLFRASEQPDLLSVDKEWEKEWQGMPEFDNSHSREPYRTIHVHFKTPESVEEFSSLIGQKITTKAKSIWHPTKSIISRKGLTYSTK